MTTSRKSFWPFSLLHQEYLSGVADAVTGSAIDSAGIYQLKNVSIR